MVSLAKYYSLWFPVIILLLVLIFPHESTLSQAKRSINPGKPCNRFIVYYHDIRHTGNVTKANATSVAMTNISDTASRNSWFGMMVVFDDPLTAEQQLSSRPVARAQGFYLYDAKRQFNAWFGYTLVFNTSEYEGTLNVMGADITSEKTRDLSVVGGTGDFFMARGIVTFSTEALEGDYYFRLKMDVKLYECY